MNIIPGFLNASVSADKIALFDGLGKMVQYGELRNQAERIKASFVHGLILARVSNNLETISFLVSAIEATVPILLVDEQVEDSYFEDLIRIYKPAYVLASNFNLEKYEAFAFQQSGLTFLQNSQPTTEVHPSLGLLLGTSGSTGNPKFVRLSHQAVRSNASDIAEGLAINKYDIAVTCLPISYSYGLSIVNSHLTAGASVLVTNESVVSSNFWTLIQQNEVSCFAGVPTTYRMLKQMHWSPEKYPSLRYMTQAGGKLQDADRTYFLDLLKPSGIEFIVMYGQTEATARITICPQKVLEQNISTAGISIPNGTIQINEPNADGVGNVVYRGANVMMGYAECADDLKLGDELAGELQTGDLGYLVDGVLFLTGRAKRIVKIFGVRVALDDVDSWVSEFGNGVALQGEDSLIIVLEGAHLASREIQIAIASRLGVHPSGVKVITVESMPLLSSGKIDMVSLTEMTRL